MKNRELFTLQAGIQSAGDLKGVKLAYALSVNLKRVASEIEALQAGVKQSEGMTEYEETRVALCKTFSRKDEVFGDPVVIDGSFDIEDVAAFNEELIALQKHFTSAIEADNLAKQEYNDLLEEESTIELIKVSLDNFPEDISATQMSQLMEMVKED